MQVIPKAKELTLSDFRDVRGYEGLYLVTDDGEVISCERIVDNGRGLYIRPMRTLKQGYRDGGYKSVCLCRDGKMKTHSVHRLVAEAFIENPNDLPEVNHIDENPENNCVGNLEWCTKQYNIEYSKRRPVIQYDYDGTAIARYRSISYAARITGISRTSIGNALRGYSQTAGGYKWGYCERKGDDDLSA